MKSINSDVEKVLQSRISNSRPSVSFEHVWDEYTNQKSGVRRRWSTKKLVIAASVFALMIFIANQTPVMAYVEQLLKVKIINKGEKAKLEGHWGGPANMSVVDSKEEVKKMLGMPVPWPTINKDSVDLVAVAQGKGYNHSFSLNNRSYYLWARYKEDTTPGFYVETAGTASEKDITVQGVPAKLVTSSDFSGIKDLYFEKGDWKFWITTSGYGKDQLSETGYGKDEQTITKELISVAESIQ